MCLVKSSSGLPPVEAPVMIVEKRKLFFSFLSLVKSRGSTGTPFVIMKLLYASLHVLQGISFIF